MQHDLLIALALAVFGPAPLSRPGHEKRVIKRGEDQAMGPVLPGRYRHYKGKEYTVIGVARHSETEEEMVVYRQEYGDQSLWVRSRVMFTELVEVNGRLVPRFQYLGTEGK
jgi:hypothetical protein